MRFPRAPYLALALAVGLNAPPAWANRPAETSRHQDSGVVIYFGSSGGHIINDRHGRGDRQSYRQGYRDGYRDGRHDNRHTYRNDRPARYHRYDPGFARPSRDYQRPRPSARHGLTAGDR